MNTVYQKPYAQTYYENYQEESTESKKNDITEFSTIHKFIMGILVVCLLLFIYLWYTKTGSKPNVGNVTLAINVPIDSRLSDVAHIDGLYDSYIGGNVRILAPKNSVLDMDMENNSILQADNIDNWF